MSPAQRPLAVMSVWCALPLFLSTRVALCLLFSIMSAVATASMDAMVLADTETETETETEPEAESNTSSTGIPAGASAPVGAEPAAAQDSPPQEHVLQEIKGTVRVKGTGAPLAGVLVFVSDDRRVFVKTDASGGFSLKVKATALSISFRRADFEEKVASIGPEGLVGGSTIFMERSATYREVGIIRARRKSEVSQQSLTRSDLANIAGSGGDAVRGLQTLPSVLATNPGSAEIVVRGGAPGDNKFYFDRLELPFIYHLGGLGTVVPLRVLSGVDLFAGGFSALYPDVTSAVVQLKSESSIPERFSGEVELSLLQSSVYAEGSVFNAQDRFLGPASKVENPASVAAAEGSAGSLDASNVAPNPDEKPVAGTSKATGIGYRLGFRRSYLELLVPALLDRLGEDLSITTVPQITDYQILLNGNHSRGTWQYYLVGAANRLRLAAPTRQTDDQSGRSEFRLFNYFEVMGFRYSLDLARDLGLSVVPQQSLIIVDQEFFSNVVKVRSLQYSVDTSLTKGFGQKVTATLGFRPQWDFTTTDVDAIQIPAGGFTPFFDPDTAPRSAEKRKRQTTFGSVYLDLLAEPSDKLTINPGVVYLRGRTARQQEIDPRLGARYSLNESHVLKAAWGQYSQLPNPAFDAPGYGNPSLKLERSDHYVAGWEYALASNWSSDLQVYYKDLYQLVGTATQNSADKYENNISGRARGFEVFLRKNPSGRYDGSLAYGYSKAERRDPVTGKWRLSDFDRTHNVTLVTKYKVTGQWTLGLRFQYQTGSLDSSILGGTFNQNTGRYRPIPKASVGLLESNDVRNPDFMQLNVRSDYDVWFQTWTFSWFGEVQLAPPGGNVVATRWNEDYSKKTSVRGLPFLPNLGIKASF